MENVGLRDPNSRWPPLLSPISLFLRRAHQHFQIKEVSEVMKEQESSCLLVLKQIMTSIRRQIVHTLAVQGCLKRVMFILDCFSFDAVPRCFPYFKIHLPPFFKIKFQSS